jgi:hypothetical protein
MSRALLPLAGFQVTLIGRFWVTAEARGVRKFIASVLSKSPIIFLRNAAKVMDYEYFEDLLVHYHGWRHQALPTGCDIRNAYFFQLYRKLKGRKDLFDVYTLLYSTVWAQ